MTAPGARTAGLMRGFPGWRAWRSDKGRLWATRVGANRETPRPAPAGWAMTVDADDTMQLRAVLAEQEEMAGPGG